MHAVAFDVTDATAVAAAVARIETEIAPVDILVNNAGMQKRTPLQDFEMADWQQLMRTNLDSVFVVGQAVARHMIQAQRTKGTASTCSRSTATSVPRALTCSAQPSSSSSNTDWPLNVRLDVPVEAQAAGDPGSAAALMSLLASSIAVMNSRSPAPERLLSTVMLSPAGTRVNIEPTTAGDVPREAGAD